ncbi:hypothetical protein SDC9_74579 [bioreactor metagenome]|uniref:Peptidase M6-like domain-containing protein n=1 Tax=bioreactor metagenome TaxID=1076179 RepID=A0A644YHG3_9ZZZZ
MNIAEITIIKAEDFIIVEQDAPLGMVAHEFGHKLELPDLYGSEEPIRNWTIMSGGSYNGRIIGSATNGLGAYCREELQKSCFLGKYVQDIVPIMDGGRIIGVISIFRDITEIKQLTDKLEYANTTIKQLYGRQKRHRQRGSCKICSQKQPPQG